MYIYGCDGENHVGSFNVRSDLESVLTAMFETIFSEKDAELGPSSHEDVVDIFLNAATFSKHVEGSAEKSMSFEDFRNWCALLPSVKKYLASLLMPPDAGFLPALDLYILWTAVIFIVFYFASI